jgi:hypothetical protein
MSTGVFPLEPPPDDFPVLEVSVHMNQPEFAHQWCKGVVFLRACAVIDFDAGKCYIYVVNDSEMFLREELSHRHCEGYDHRGENTIRGAFEQWKKK